jgi:D-alanyl-D-alanine carboxypeptidase
MKKHVAAWLAVLILLFGTYIVGHIGYQKIRPNSVTKPARTTHETPTQPAGFNKKLYALDEPSSLWVVVNKQRPLNPKTYAPTDLSPIGNGQKMRLAAANQLKLLFDAAKSASYTLIAESGYRSYSTQVSVYNHEVSAFGQTKADSESARPGYSEHQTGWAVDIGSPGCYEDCFGTKPASKWLLANAYRYGFILRYPVDKSTITGYRNEPWHFRYVGVDLAAELHNTRTETLEEFFGLPAAPNYP